MVRNVAAKILFFFEKSNRILKKEPPFPKAVVVIARSKKATKQST